MLVTYGQVFAQTKERMEELENALNNAGFQFAYLNQQTATIIKEVPDEQKD